MISSYCNFGDCVEVAPLGDGGVIVRDTKMRGRPDEVHLHFTSVEWSSFVTAVKAGEFDLPSIRPDIPGAPTATRRG